MELYMMNRQHGRMILEFVENGLLIWPSIEENGVTRTKKYFKLSATKVIQADCDIKATNIILQGLPLEVYALERECKLYDEFDKFAYKKRETLRDFYLRFSLLLNDLNISNMKLEQFQVNTKFLNTLPLEWGKFVISKGDDPIDVINYMMSFLTVVGRHTSFAAGTTRTYTLGASGSNSGKQRIVICYNCKGEGHMSKQCTKPKRKRDDSWFKDKVLLIQAQANGQNLHEEELAFLADPGITEVALMANLSHYDSDALAKVHNHDNVNNNMINQAVQAMSSSEQSNVNSNSFAQQDALILSVIEQLKTQVVNCIEINLDNKSVTELKVNGFEEGKCCCLRSRSNDNVSDSSAQSVEIDRLKQTLSEHLKEKESLMQTVTLLKNDFKKEESRNIGREIALEKKIKQVDKIVFKRDQSAQTVHMLTKPQFFYDHTTKQALGFQNPFYLKKAPQLEPKRYDGNVIKNTSAIVIPDSEETLMLAEESHSKMLLKQEDPMMLEKKVNITPVDYVVL
ncbi:integrase, catalytic region, zinc finger, CCHC-type containing protein [Tanacetum coccineum]